MTKVMIVEDDPMASKLLEIFVKESDRYSVAHTIDNASMAEMYCLKNPIDLILMDVCTAMNANGLDAAAKIKKSFPHIKVIIMTSQPECSFIDRARSIGVDSFWYKESTAEKVIEVMDRTMNGESVYPDTTPTLQLGNAKSSEFSPKELEVLRELISGESDAVIADKLHMSLRTVKAHIQTMRDKTGFRNRTELAVRARECGLVINEYKDE
ncbi:MAG: response regulator transcription factor [Clostridia bacterium]|nr:response regulator transcription factor [Clostridia bacterium]